MDHHFLHHSESFSTGTVISVSLPVKTIKTIHFEAHANMMWWDFKICESPPAFIDRPFHNVNNQTYVVLSFPMKLLTPIKTCCGKGVKLRTSVLICLTYKPVSQIARKMHKFAVFMIFLSSGLKEIIGQERDNYYTGKDFSPVCKRIFDVLWILFGSTIHFQG